MTIHSRRLVRQEQQRTQATLYNEHLAETRNQQAAQMMPRSQASWSAEQGRLGSWRGGVGRFQIDGPHAGLRRRQLRPAVPAATRTKTAR